ncbi:MAG: sugar ABC transporter substrate-binding protein [Defluviitaleaceae bacterium]|nr:sugar ABC transporter substrate-binding protein [Defluviitaleaceae bacterium]
MKMKSILVNSVAVLMAMALLVGCAQQPAPAPAPAEDGGGTAAGAPAGRDAPAPADNVHLRFAMWDEIQAPTFQEILDLFMDQHPGITVELELTPWTQYWVRLDAAAGAGDLPDVFWMNVWVPRFADGGVIRPIDDLVARDGIDLAAWSPATVGNYTHNNQLWALPKGHDIVNVYYNRSIFENYGVQTPQPGWTWADMIDMGIELRDAMAASGSGLYPIAMELDPHPSHFNFILQEGGYIASPEGTFGWELPETTRAIQDILDLMDMEILPSFAVLSDTRGTDIFLAGRSAMLFAGSWQVPLIDDASFGPYVGVVQMPRKSVHNYSVLGGLGYVMAADTVDVEAAWLLQQFLAGYDSNRMQAQARIEMPAYLAAQHYYLENFNHVDAQVLLDTAQTAVPFPRHVRLQEMMGVVNEVMPQVFARMMTPEEGTSEIQSRWTEIAER